jgi:hypothetical protein
MTHRSLKLCLEENRHVGAVESHQDEGLEICRFSNGGSLSRAHNLTIALALASVSDAPHGEECRRDALQELGIMARDATAQCRALWEELF